MEPYRDIWSEELLAKGWTVHATVRNKAKSEALLRSRVGDPGEDDPPWLVDYKTRLGHCLDFNQKEFDISLENFYDTA